ncbi:MAG: FAD-binding protein [Solirubrobacterales bacterium]|nr:FAD-binding protein [Solirubrobacterales bacterium]
MTRLTFSLRREWRNHTGNQGIDPLRVLKPTTLQEVVQIVRDAERDGCTVRAVGSGHSWSDVALTRGFVLLPTELAVALELEEDLLDAERAHREPLVRVQAGMRIRELNAHLDSRGLALRNMGGYDGQTVAGVISTSTHGSGLRFGPITDDVRSLDIVGSGGALYRIEPADGITDPVVFADRRPEWTLLQDDVTFNAARVGMGCLGVIYSATLAVREKFYLREVRTMSTWDEVRAQLAGGALLSDNSHCEIYFNPYQVDGAHHCLITTRNEVAPDQYERDPHRSRHFIAELLSRLPVTPWGMNLVQGLWPSSSPSLIDRALKALADRDYTNVSYRVFNIGTANDLPAYSAEIGVPVDDRGLHIQAVEKIFEVAARHRKLGHAYQSSPISLRFVQASDALMSMMYGRDTMMIELIMLTHTEGGFELLADYEEAFYALGGRPHWGQVNSLTGSDGLITSMYPRFDDWLAVHRQLNASGVFDSPFSKRVGISASRFVS